MRRHVKATPAKFGRGRRSGAPDRARRADCVPAVRAGFGEGEQGALVRLLSRLVVVLSYHAPKPRATPGFRRVAPPLARPHASIRAATGRGFW